MLEEHLNPLPKCKHCGSQVPAGRLNTRHYASENCKQGEERRLRCKTLQSCFESSRVSFQFNAEDLPSSEAFPYLGRTIAYNNSDWSAVYQNLRISQRGWRVIVRVLVKTGATARARGMMYKSVARSVLLYGSESWVVTGEMLTVPEGFHHRAARRITGMTATRGAGGEWEYPPVAAAMEATGLHPIRGYIRRRQATIAEKVSLRPMYELCAEAERMTGMRQMSRWWDQDVVNEPEE